MVTNTRISVSLGLAAIGGYMLAYTENWLFSTGIFLLSVIVAAIILKDGEKE